MKQRTGNFKYVPWDRIEDFHRQGWFVVGDLCGHHGFWSVLMWRCDCEMSS